MSINRSIYKLILETMSLFLFKYINIYTNNN